MALVSEAAGVIILIFGVREIIGDVPLFLMVNYEDEEIRFTISLGIARCIEGEEDQIGWLNRSDQALDRSK